MFKTIYGEYASEIVEKKSKFIGKVKAIGTELEAKEYINVQRKIYYDARHIVYGYILGKEEKRYSDDGEPSLTAGVPILKILEHGNFFYTIVIVVRYFGGILLGTGGLSRAYSLAAQKVLEQAIILENEEYERVAINFRYEFFSKINNELRKNNCYVEEIIYDTEVRVIFLVRENFYDNILEKIGEILGKKIFTEKVKVIGTIYDKKFISYGDRNG